MTEPKTTTADHLPNCEAVLIAQESNRANAAKSKAGDWYEPNQFMVLCNCGVALGRKDITPEAVQRAFQAIGFTFMEGEWDMERAAEAMAKALGETSTNDSSPRNQETPDVNPAH